MKPEKIIAGIVENSEYDRLVKLWSSENGNGQDLPSEILEIVQALSEIIKKKKTSFLFSSGLKPHLDQDTISFRVPQHIQDAKCKFDRELNEQMPLFVKLMNSIPVKSLIPDSIAV